MKAVMASTILTRMETIIDDCEDVMAGLPSVSVKPVENVLSQYGIARIPPMVPVSYPKSTPPNATKRPTQMAGHALPGVPAGGLSWIGILIQVARGLDVRCEGGCSMEADDVQTPTVAAGRAVFMVACTGPASQGPPHTHPIVPIVGVSKIQMLQCGVLILA
jgi:hypothetical protein